MDKFLDFKRLSYLGDKVKLKTASSEEKDEFMRLLYQNGDLTEKQFKDYKAGRNAQEIVDAALAIGAVLLIAYLIGELLKK
ncbi:MAG: hypothetical protein RIE86_16945 [Imperialibacter sp.]|uniref:hypothetical protein n=1 Tax=Imperialibacter sp. TaxID=2038411 RepID=UPI0032ED0D2F